MLCHAGQGGRGGLRWDPARAPPGPSSRTSTRCGARSSCCSGSWHTFITCPSTGRAAPAAPRREQRWHSSSSTRRWVQPPGTLLPSTPSPGTILSPLPGAHRLGAPHPGTPHIRIPSLDLSTQGHPAPRTHCPVPIPCSGTPSPRTPRTGSFLCQDPTPWDPPAPSPRSSGTAIPEGSCFGIPHPELPAPRGDLPLIPYPGHPTPGLPNLGPPPQGTPRSHCPPCRFSSWRSC